MYCDAHLDSKLLLNRVRQQAVQVFRSTDWGWSFFFSSGLAVIAERHGPLQQARNKLSDLDGPPAR
jgi:hypothetical protein